MKELKIGIMGGTFNPIHNGHLQIAQAAQTKFELQQIWFMPSNISYMKQNLNVASTKHRIEMTNLAIEDYPNFILSTIEIERGGNTYTYETLEQLKTLYPSYHFFFIIGADSLFNLEKWRYPERILSCCTILVAARDDKNDQEVLDKIKDLTSKYQADIRLIITNPISVSSTLVRERLKNNQSLSNLVPLKVEQYIKINNLYL